MVTPATGAIVFETEMEHQAFLQNRNKKLSFGLPQSSGYSGLVGAPVDPRYAQSNEIGQLSDFGYDTARDISRFATVLTFVIACIVAVFFVRGQKPLSNQRLAKAAALILLAPWVTHMIGTFMINNYGGLGGGL